MDEARQAAAIYKCSNKAKRRKLHRSRNAQGKKIPLNSPPISAFDRREPRKPGNPAAPGACGNDQNGPAASSHKNTLQLSELDGFSIWLQGRATALICCLLDDDSGNWPLALRRPPVDTTFCRNHHK
jgi:hypothetical protein